jgi:hypothetical protein
MPNRSLKLTRYGSRRLAAPGRFGNLPSTANTVCLRGQLSSNVKRHEANINAQPKSGVRIAEGGNLESIRILEGIFDYNECRAKR